MILTLESYLDSIGVLMHYGTPRHSGRYPWGSGEKGQRNRAFLGYVDDLKKQGLSESEIAQGMGMSVSQLRSAKSIAKNEEKQALYSQAARMRAKGMSNVAIGERLDLNESSVRALLASGVKDRLDTLDATTDLLRAKIDSGAYLDVGAGVEQMLGISTTQLKNAIAKLESEGYTLERVQVDQLTTPNKTTFRVLAPPGTTYADIVTNKENIQQIKEFSNDGGLTYFGIKPPMNLDSKRVQIIYDEDGGSLADGVIYVRPGVKDISIGDASYAQVRIAVDGTHYMKGMAVYKDGMPPGVDIQYNVTKSKLDYGDDKLGVMKSIKDDPDNPFGAIVRQRIDPKTGELTSVMNTVGSKEGAGEAGSWGDWSKNLSTQFLSKQSPTLAEEQLAKAFQKKQDDYDEIMSLTNPAVRRKLLESFADDADSSAVHLKAAAMPRQATHVILPVNSLKDTEVYAPNYNNGERVALVRYPHAGTFEIPELTVNNNNREARKLLGTNPPDAIGINSKVAARMSGADFDGDAVLVIPNNSGKIKSTAPLASLKDFDTRRAYPPFDGMKTIDGGTWDAKAKKVIFPEGKTSSPRGKGDAMGSVSNLITDMSLRGATHTELARAVRHSMVVIDSEKHVLNYKQSETDNGIRELKAKYQGGPNKGAATLISRATSEIRVPLRKTLGVDKETGKKIYSDPTHPYKDAKGNIKYRTTASKKLAETSDAFSLVSRNGGTKMEQIYATHSNKLKSLANTARKEAVNTPPIKHSPSAKRVFKDEVASLESKLARAYSNRPLERQAQVIGNAVYSAKKQSNPNMSREEEKKVKYQSLTAARIRTGASRSNFSITDGEWKAIQAGAITNTRLNEILKYADLDRVKELATPRKSVSVSSSTASRIRSMSNNGYTQAEIAKQLGISTGTVSDAIKGGS